MNVCLSIVQPNPIIVAPMGTNGRNQPYLKPTLTGKNRPVSAPSFERYVEYFDLRSTSSGHPAHIGLSYSEQSSPKAKGKNPLIFVKGAVGTDFMNHQPDSHEDVQL